jgi:hypothetical protein
MDCKFIWWNLPKKIKEKIGIDLLYNWNRLPIEVNTFLRQFEDEDNSTYSQFFTPKYKTNWFKLVGDLDKICQAFSDEPSGEVEILERFEVFLNDSNCTLMDEITLYRLNNATYSDEALTTTFTGTVYFPPSIKEVTEEEYLNGVLVSSLNGLCA